MQCQQAGVAFARKRRGLAHSLIHLISQCMNSRPRMAARLLTECSTNERCQFTEWSVNARFVEKPGWDRPPRGLEAAPVCFCLSIVAQALHYKFMALAVWRLDRPGKSFRPFLRDDVVSN